MKKSLVWRLLRRNISVGQLAGYALANLVGLSIVMTAIQFYRDFSKGAEEDSFAATEFLILSKRVSALNTLTGLSAEFTPEEVEDISAQPWAKKTGEFASADFNVYASMELGGRGMSTYLFFESVPDEFFDVKPTGWKFSEDKPEIPIIISKDYLTLYNFGFAAGRGLPQLSEDIIKKVPLTIRLSGNGRAGVYKARIVGFSSRLNTIAVPEAFMEWANSVYAENPSENPSRIIVEVTDPGNPAITEYMETHGYEIGGDKVDSGKMTFFMNIATGVVIAVGVIISLLAFFILLLSIHLLIQKSGNKIHDLILLGYSPANVGRYYICLTCGVNLLVLIFSSAIMLGAASWWSVKLESIDIGSASSIPTLAIGTLIIIAVSLSNVITIMKAVNKRFFN